MPALLLLLPQIIALLPTVTTGVQYLIQWIASIRGAAQQSGIWTPELETAFLDALLATATDPAYQPDSAVPQPPTIGAVLLKN